MAALRIVLTVILILVSIVFTAIVLMQEGKSAGLGAISGGNLLGQEQRSFYGRCACQAYKGFGRCIYVTCNCFKY